jgi:anaerobic magnesium-protoporphyrin IX monomethyl ester cyclase
MERSPKLPQKKLKILLIVPPAELRYSKLATSSDILNKAKCYPAIGLGYIASALEKTGYDVTYVDFFASKKKYNDIIEIMRLKDPDIVGLTCNISTYIPVKILAYLVKSVKKSCLVVIGGILLNIYPEEIMSCPFFDYGVIGEGEETIVDLLHHIETDGNVESVDGVVYKRGSVITKTHPRRINNRLDSLPFPAWHLMPMERYRSDISRNRTLGVILTSRGCPFHCTYCYNETPWRSRSPTNVVDEVELLYRSENVREFYFTDATFSVDRKRVRDICRELIRRKIAITWQCETRLDCIDETTLAYMRKAGCRRILCGIESGCNVILRRIEKKLTVNLIRKSIQQIKDSGMEIYASFMLGLPGETLSTMEKTIEFARELDLDYVLFTIATAAPGTKMLEDALKEGTIERDYWRDFVAGQMHDFPVMYLKSPKYSFKDLHRMVRKGYTSFYLRPKYIFNRLKKVKLFSELKNNLGGIKNLLIELLFITNVIRKH